MKAKNKVIHRPKKMVFSRSSFNSSMLNLSMNYKKQASSLRTNNRELARQLNVVQQKLKTSETVICDLQKSYHQQALRVIQGNLGRMAVQMRSFLDILEQTINFCSHPNEVDVDSTILNPDLDISSTPTHSVNPVMVTSSQHVNMGPSRLGPQKGNNHIDVVPMTPILEQSTREGLEIDELLNPASSDKMVGPRFSNVTRRTKSKSRSFSNAEETPPTSGTSPKTKTLSTPDSPVQMSTVRLNSENGLSLTECLVQLDRLPSFITPYPNATPEIYKSQRNMFLASGNSSNMPKAVGGLSNTLLVPSNWHPQEADDDVTVKIPIDMDLTLVKETAPSKIEVFNVQHADAKETVQPQDQKTFNGTDSVVQNSSDVGKIRVAKQVSTSDKPLSNKTASVSSVSHTSELKSTKGKLIPHTTKQNLNSKMADKASSSLLPVRILPNSVSKLDKDSGKLNAKKSVKKSPKPQSNNPDTVQSSLENDNTNQTSNTTSQLNSVTSAQVEKTVERVLPSTSKQTDECLSEPANLKGTKRRSILRVSLAASKKVGPDSELNPGAKRRESRKSVCFTAPESDSPIIGAKRAKRINYIVDSDSSRSDDSPQKKQTDTQKTSRTQRINYAVDSDSSSSDESTQKQIVKKKTSKVQRGSENFTFFSKQKKPTKSKSEGGSRKKKPVPNQPASSGLSPLSVFDLSFKDPSPKRGKPSTGKGKELDSAKVESVVDLAEEEKHQEHINGLEKECLLDSSTDADGTLIYNENDSESVRASSTKRGTSRKSNASGKVSDGDSTPVARNAESKKKTRTEPLSNLDYNLPSQVVSGSLKKVPSSKNANKTPKSTGRSGATGGSVDRPPQSNLSLDRRKPSGRYSSREDSENEQSYQNSEDGLSIEPEPSRRRQKVVSYKEPNLNKKMRRH